MIDHPSQEILKDLFNYRKDGKLIRRTNVSHSKKGDTVGTFNNVNGYLYNSVNSITYRTHRLIWIWHHGYNAENGLDHIDRNKINNRIENLREVTQSCNSRNYGNPCDNKSGVKGVCWCLTSKKWRVQIAVNRKSHFLGSHDDFNEAVLHRLAGEQCLDWEGCDSSSPAYKYAIKHKLIKGEE